MVVFPFRPVIQSVIYPSCPDEDLWELKDDYFDPDSGIYIRTGYRFDGASIPRFFWRFIGHPMEGDFLAPSLLHDAKYASQYGTKEEADKEFLDDLKTCGVGFVRRWLMYWAVKHFGKCIWDDIARTNAPQWNREMIELKGEEVNG